MPSASTHFLSSHFACFSTRREFRARILIAAAVAMAAMLAAPQVRAAAAPTTTTLTVSPASPVAAGTAVTLTAAVSNGLAVTAGTVKFCDTSFTYCLTTPALLGTAQLTSAGTAVMKFVPGIGSHSYQAVFTTTTANATNTSSTQSLTVTGTGVLTSTTTIAQSGSAGAYSLTGTVVASGVPAPTGSVSFKDTTNGNFVVGSAALGAATLAQTFATQVTYAVGHTPKFVAAGDFNGDGKLDLVTVNQTDSTVSVLLGNGGGTFQTQLTQVTPGASFYLAVGDFNGDGKLDLAVSSSNTVSVLLGNGDGTFQTSMFSTTVTSADAIAVGDFNGDGKLDLAVTGTNVVNVLLGNGDGTFQTAVSYATGSSPRSIAVGDFNGDGKLDLAVVNEGSSNGTNGLSVLLGNGDGTFQTQVNYTTSGNPISVAAGDFNGDGNLDLVVANIGNSTLGVLLGTGAGTFGAQVTYSEGSAAVIFVAIGDFNGDGKLDLVGINQGGGTAITLLGNGDGTFQTEVSYATGNNPDAVAVGDFNGDGKPDLATVNQADATVSVLLDSVTQTATATQTGISVPGSGTAHLVDASYGGDTNFSGSTSGTTSLTSSKQSTVTVMSASPASSIAGQSVTLTATLSPSSLGNLITTGDTVTFKNGATTLGTGTVNSLGVATFTLTTLTGGTNSLSAVYSGDANFLTSTGLLEFTVGTSTTTTLALSSASVTAGTVVTFTAAVSNPSAVTTGTVNFCDATKTSCTGLGLLGTAQLTSAGTAVIKLVPGVGSHSYKAVFAGITGTSDSSVSSAQPLTVTATGKFSTTTAISSSGSAGNYTLTGTVAGAGIPGPTGSVSFVDTTNGNFVLGSASLGASTSAQALAAQTPLTAGTAPIGAVVGDFNGDGIADIAVTNKTSGTVSVFLGNGDGTFTLKSSPATGSLPWGIAAGDFNGDGKLDLVVANSGGGTVSVLLGNGDGTFQTAVPYSAGSSPFWVAVADFNGDGKLDMAVANSGGTTVSVLLGKGDGTFQAAVPYTVGTSPKFVAVADFNEDGRPDLVVANFGSTTVSVLLGNGDGTFGAQATFTVGSAPLSIAVADFNGDGKPDMAVANDGSNTLNVLLGNGDGTFQTQATYATGVNPNSVTIGDFNGDGVADLAVANQTGNTVGVLLGNSNGTFQAQTTYATGTGPITAVVGDFNGDGLADLAVVNQTSGTVSVFLDSAAQTATAVATGVSIPGTGSAHLADASYAGDTNFNASVSSTTSLTSTQVTTTLALTAVPASSSTYGGSVTLTATLSPSAEGSLAATGETVTFKNGATTLGTGTLNSSGIATLTITALPVGADSLTAVYGTEGTFLGSTSSVLSFTVSKAVLTVTAQPASKTYGAANPTFSANITGFVNGDTQGTATTGTPSLTTTAVTGSPVNTYTITAAVGTLAATNYTFAFVNGTLTVTSPAGAASGNVTFLDGTTTLGSGALNGSGVATFTTSSLALGSNSNTAVYGATGNFLASTSPAVTQLVQQAAGVFLTSSGSPSQPGSAVTLTATVAGASVTPTGSVIFQDGGVNLGTGTLNGSGVATFSTSSLALGTHSITAVYSGDANTAAGTSTVLTQLVQQVTTNTLISNNPFVLTGANVTFTATITGSSVTPTGSVTFQEGSTTLGTGTLNGSGIATFSTTTLSMGPHSITAVYSGDADSLASTSLVATQTVQETTAITVASSNSPSLTGTSVTFAATVTTPGTGMPSGTVTFLDGSTVLGSATLNGSLQATFVITSLPDGPHSITAVYSGDVTNVSSTSVAITQNVQAVTTTPLISSSNPSVSGQSVTFTATVVPMGPFTPTGTVTFNDGGGALGTMPLSTTGGITTATFTTASLTAGTHPITTAYSGDSNNAPSTSDPLSQIVEAGTITTLSTSGSPSLLNGTVTFTVSVPAAANGQPTGTVSFRDNGTEIGTGTLDGSGNTSFATSALTLGSHPITAVYLRDALNAGSTSAVVTQNVQEQTQATVLSSMNPSQPGAMVTFTATLTPSGPGTPTGTVTWPITPRRQLLSC
jgi:hypothetical protein